MIKKWFLFMVILLVLVTACQPIVEDNSDKLVEVKDKVVFEKSWTGGFCFPENDPRFRPCLGGLKLHESGKLVEYAQGKEDIVEYLDVSFIRQLKNKIISLNLFNKDYSNEPVLDYDATYTINVDGNTKKIYFPGCEEEINEIEELISKKRELTKKKTIEKEITIKKWTNSDLLVEFNRLKELNTYPNNLNIDTSLYPKIIGKYNKNNQVLVERYFCSDLCPDYGFISIYYADVNSAEECNSVEGKPQIDFFKQFIGCLPNLSSFNDPEKVDFKTPLNDEACHEECDSFKEKCESLGGYAIFRGMPHEDWFCFKTPPDLGKSCSSDNECLTGICSFEKVPETCKSMKEIKGKYPIVSTKEYLCNTKKPGKCEKKDYECIADKPYHEVEIKDNMIKLIKKVVPPC